MTTETTATELSTQLICDGCDEYLPENQASYHCRDCEPYDLCEQCFQKDSGCEHPNDNFIALPVAEYIKSEWYTRFKYYRYPLEDPRQQIRLLLIHPSEDFDAPIEACIKVIYLHDISFDTNVRNLSQGLPSFPYSALSYTWGTSPPTKSMTIGISPFPITEHLERALKRLRQHILGTIVWIDAICINQRDDDEKGHQVQMMRDIYSNASSVFVYLGEYNDQIRLPEDFGSGTEWLCSEGEPQDNLPPKSTADFAFDLLLQPWFTRAWVIQEATCHCRVSVLFGPLTFPLWRLLFLVWCPFSTLFIRRRNPNHYAARIIDELGKKATLRDQSLIKMAQENIPGGSSIDFTYGHDINYRLIDILRDLRVLSATNPKDKIYALLGLATDCVDAPPVNYSLSTSSIYVDFAWYFLSKGQGIEVLHAAGGHDYSIDLPSWVPDWSSKSERFAAFDRIVANHSAAGGPRSELNSGKILHQINDNATFLGVTGCTPAKVCWLGPKLGIQDNEDSLKINDVEMMNAMALSTGSMKLLCTHGAGQPVSANELLLDNRLADLPSCQRKSLPLLLRGLSFAMNASQLFLQYRPPDWKIEDETEAAYRFTDDTVPQKHQRFSLKSWFGGNI